MRRERFGVIDYDKLLRMRVLASGESLEAIRKQLHPYLATSVPSVPGGGAALTDSRQPSPVSAR